VNPHPSYGVVVAQKKRSKKPPLARQMFRRP
jgi:hypothetical protein